MVRSRLLSMDIFDHFARLPASERRTIAARPNESYDQRLAENEGRNIWPERGFNLQELAPTSIPNTVANRGWEQYTGTPESYHPDLVREFYAAMVPEVFHAHDFVWVRRRKVQISVEAINNYLHTAPQPNLAVNDGMPQHAFFQDPHDPRIAAALRRNGNPTWIPEVEDLRYAELFPDINMWGIFVKHSLMPSRNRTNVMNKDGQVLFAIQQGLDMDVGRIIFWEILNAGRLHGSLPFPCLITHFCREAGIPAASDPDELEAPMTNINRKSYNSFCRTYHLALLPTGRPVRVRQRNQIPENVAQQVNEEPEEAAAPQPFGEQPPPPPPFGGQGVDPQQWMTQMMAITQANANSTATLSQDFASFRSLQDTRHTEYLADRARYGGRIDDIYTMLGGHHSGTAYSRRPRSNDPGTSSQHPGSSSMHPGDRQ